MQLLSRKNLISKRGMLSQLLQRRMMGGGPVSYWMKQEEWKEEMCFPATLSVCSNRFVISTDSIFIFLLIHISRSLLRTVPFERCVPHIIYISLILFFHFL